MYTRQDKHQRKIGYGGYGNFGQVPTATVTLTLGSKVKVTLTGPAHEVGIAGPLVALLNSAVTGAQKGQSFQAQAALTQAKAMLPATGSLKAQVEPLVAAAEREVNVVPVFTSAAGKARSTLLVAGLGMAALVGFFLLKRR